MICPKCKFEIKPSDIVSNNVEESEDPKCVCHNCGNTIFLIEKDFENLKKEQVEADMTKASTAKKETNDEIKTKKADETVEKDYDDEKSSKDDCNKDYESKLDSLQRTIDSLVTKNLEDKEKKRIRKEKTKKIGKVGLMVLPVVIVIVAIFLLLWGFLGLNGTYVCVEDSNQYYSFSFSKFINVDPNYLFERTGGSFIVKSGKIKFNTKFGAVGKELLNAMGVDGKYELDFEKIDGTKVIKIDGKIFVRVSRKQANKIIGKSVILNFNDMNGNNDYAIVSGKIGDYASEPVDIPQKDGSIFIGWNTNSDAPEQGFWYNENSVIWGNATYCALWKHIHQYSYTYSCKDRTCIFCGEVVKGDGNHSIDKTYTCGNRICIDCGTVVEGDGNHTFSEQYTCGDRRCTECNAIVIGDNKHRFVENYSCGSRKCMDCGANVSGNGKHVSDDNSICAVCGEIDLSKISERMKDRGYYRAGDEIYFGSYPQTRVYDDYVISALVLRAGGLPSSADSKAWKSYGYYINGSVSDYMWYIDLVCEGEKYRGVYFTSYRPYGCTNGSESNTYQDDNKYYVSTVYWFKYEPIRWSILNESDGHALILADLALDSQQYYHNSNRRVVDGKSVYANNYAESEIRKWLNDTFYNVAFNTLQKELIQITEIDNSVSSTGYDSNIYACENTFDKVFLLSYAEMFLYLTNVLDGQMKSTDYAKSQGCWQSTDSDNNGNCRWWLRSPIVVYSDTVRNVYYNGEAYGKNTVHINECGVVPALVISLS